MLVPVDAALDGVPLLVPVAVEGRRPSTGRAELQPVRPLVALLRDRVGYAAAAPRSAGGGVGVGLVGDQVIGTLARPPRADAGHPDAVEQGQQLRVVPGLTGGEPVVLDAEVVPDRRAPKPVAF